MLGSLRTTVVLLFILILTVISSALSSRNQEPRQPRGIPSQQLIEQQQREEERLRGQFPVVDYDAPDNPDPKELSKRREKNKHFDKRNLVHADPAPRVVESARIIEGYDVPALPTAQSGLVITGEVLAANAYLSNDKSGVYTELTVRIQEVLKNSVMGQFASGVEIRVAREGGIVRYANGHQRLYHLAEEGMPSVGKRYVLFLRADEHGEDLYVITGYELSPAGVVPVDESQRFKAYESYDPQTFLNAIRSSVEQTPQAPNN